MTKFIPIFFLMIAVAGAYAVDPLYYLWKKQTWATAAAENGRQAAGWADQVS